MICLGPQPSTTTKGYDYTVAHLRAYQLFKTHFMARNPGGLVLSELEYKGATTFASAHSHSIRVANRQHTRILDALATDFRNGNKDRGFRKPDGLAINAQGTVGELLEVTAVTNRRSAETQIQDKLRNLHEVNRIYNLNVHWKATDWRPATAERELFYKADAQAGELLRWVCYQPTYREAAQPGTMLYEMHAILKGSLRSVPATVVVPIGEILQAAYKQQSLGIISAAAWAERFIHTHPTAKPVLQGLARTLGVGMAVATVVLIFDPVPGDETAAASVAMMLFRLARI